MKVSVIEEFLARYSKEYDYYQKIAAICAQRCESEFSSSGIRAIVTHRAKRPDRLRIKLETRHKGKKSYTSVSEIYEDIIDLAGVRIAVYFPKASEEIDVYLRKNFDVITDKFFPEQDKPNAYDKRFSGYGARHYRVRLERDTLTSETQHYGEGIIEVQVASVLMHAWAEVEHDLVYKPLSGKLSKEEYKILDELNGLVLSGEIALERLQDAGRARVSKDKEPFNNHYELSSYLYSLLEDPETKRYEEFPLGNTRLLYALLERIGLNKPGDIKNFIASLDSDDGNGNIADKLIDQIIQGDPVYYGAHEEVRAELEGRGHKVDRTHTSREYAFGYFISKWVALESLILIMGKKRHPDELHQSVLGSKFLEKIGLFDFDQKNQIESLRHLRNQVVHGVKSPDEGALIKSGRQIEKLINDMLDRFPDDKELIEEVKNRFKI